MMRQILQRRGLLILKRSDHELSDCHRALSIG